MARVTGPLLSVSASGTIGERLTFSKRASGQQARFQRKQKDSKTSEQEEQREKFSSGLILWKSMPLEERELWTSAEAFGYVII